MYIAADTALWFLPLVLPICFYVAFSDMAWMRITNPSVILLALIFIVVGALLLPLDTYLWRLFSLLIVLGVGIALNAAGVIGAGDAKFSAAAAPFVALGDLRLVLALFMATSVAAAITHRGIKHTPLRRLAPGWASWHETRRFPMGLALAPTLALYLLLGSIYGA